MTTSPTPPLPQSPHLPPPNPYVGPRTFSADQRHLFFGREREARDLLARVLSERLLLFYAQSGAGKSSLLHARLIPLLQEEKGFVVLPVGRVSGELPAGVAQVDNIFVYNLLLSVEEGSEPGLLAQVSLGDFLARLARRSVGDADSQERKGWVYDPELASAPAGAAPGTRRYALIVDQFEEIITSHPARWREREDFFRQVDAALAADPNLWVVLTLREDYVAALDPYAELCFNRLRARFYMERMDGAAALEAIRRPAELGGRPFAAGVAEQLVDNLRQVRVPGQETTVAGQYVEPVQLQVVCYQLWEKLHVTSGRLQVAGGGQDVRSTADPESAIQPASLLITETDLKEAGNVDQALTAFYEETLAAALADPAAAGVRERQVRAWFDEQLVTEAGTRGLVHQGERESGGLPNGVVAALQSRFLVRGEARGGDVWIELVHDRFVEPIRASNAAWFPQHLSALQRQAELWIEQGRSSGLLLRDAALAEAEAWAAGHPEELGDGERQFLEVCRQAQQAVERERRDSRRIRLLALGAAIVAVVAIVAAVFGVTGQQQARTAEQTAMAQATRALNAEATAVSERVVAQDNANLAATREADARAAEATAVAERSRADAKAIEAKEQWEIAELEKQRAEAQARRAKAGELVVHTQTELADKTDASGSLALILARSAVLTTWRADKTATINAEAVLRDAIDAAPPWRMTLPPGYGHDIASVAFSPDSKAILTIGDNGNARVWDAETGAELHQLTGYIVGGFMPGVWSAAYAPDGRTILTTGCETVDSDGRCTDATARIWDATTGEEIRQFGTHSAGVSSVIFAPDDKTIITTGCDKKNEYGLCTAGSTRLWNIATGEELYQLQSHTDWIYSATISPDGTTIVTASHDQLVRIWDVATRQELRQLRGHVSNSRGDCGISSVAYSPDGKSIVTAGWDGVARVWDADTGQEVRQFSGHGCDSWGTECGLLSAAFSPDGNSIVTTGEDGTTRIWDATAGQELRKLDGGGFSVISPNGRIIVTGSHDGTARVWDAANGSEFLEIGGSPLIHSAAFSPDGKLIVTADGDMYGGSGSARIWDANSGRWLRRLEGHSLGVLSAAFSPDGKTIVTASYDATARMWDVASGRELRQLIGHTSVVNSAVFSSDGKLIVTASEDGTARVWDGASGRELRQLKGHEYQLWMPWVGTAAFNPDGKSIVTAGGDRTTRLWDAATGQELRKLDGGSFAAYSPDGQMIITGGNETARLYAVATGQELRQLQGHSSLVHFAAFSQDGKSIVTVSSDGSARVWDAVSGLELLKLSGSNDSNPYRAAFSPDGRSIVTADNDGARVWDVVSDAQRRQLTEHTGRVQTAAFSPDGKLIITTGTGYTDTVSIWDIASGNELYRLTNDNTECAVFSPDGKLIVTGGWDAAHVWDAASGQELHQLITPEKRIVAAAFSSDGQLVITGSSDGAVITWDATSGRKLREWQAAASPILGFVTLSPDNQIVLTSHPVTLWDATSGTEIRRLEGHSGQVNTGAFSPDGARIVTAGQDGTARIWDTQSGQKLRELALGQAVGSAVFSPDGEMILTAGGCGKRDREGHCVGGSAIVWDALTGQEVRRLNGHSDEISTAAYSSDGRFIVTASYDGTARIWIANIDDLLDEAARLIQRDPPVLTPEERQRYGLE